MPTSDLPPPHQAPATPYPWRCSCGGRITVLNVEVDIDVIEQSFTEQPVVEEEEMHDDEGTW